MPAKNQKSARIHSIGDLKAEKIRLSSEIKASTEHLENIISDIPGRIIGSTLGMVGGAVVIGLKNHWQKKEEPIREESFEAGIAGKPASFGETLQEVGEETAFFALGKLVEKLLAR